MQTSKEMSEIHETVDLSVTGGVRVFIRAYRHRSRIRRVGLPMHFLLSLRGQGHERDVVLSASSRQQVLLESSNKP